MAVNLSKGQKVSLVKKTDTPVGEISINLNWSQPEKKSGFLSSLFGGNNGIDLDLGCLYELQDGEKGCVQALGNCFGSLSSSPYVALDGDDRTGENAAGETLRVNGAKISEIKRILVYTFIYEGTANWKDAKGIVTIKCQGNDFIVNLDEYGSRDTMCALALLENADGKNNFTVEKIVRFFNGHPALDSAFNWGLQWVRGSKD